MAIRFEVITDSRDGVLAYERLMLLTHAIDVALYRLANVETVHTDTRLVNFGADYQYRASYIVRKTGRAVTWNDVYRTINATYAPVYHHL